MTEKFEVSYLRSAVLVVMYIVIKMLLQSRKFGFHIMQLISSLKSDQTPYAHSLKLC